MNYNTPAQDLRGIDPTILEVQLQEMLRRAMQQIAIQNQLDIISLHDSGLAPNSVTRDVARFVERVAGELEDLPEGPEWDQYIQTVGEIALDQIPTSFRTLLSNEASRREADISSLTTAWADVEPMAFLVGSKTVQVQQRPAAGKAAEASAPPKAKATRGTAKKASTTAKPRASRKVEIDPVRLKWIQDTAIRRLAGKENGLAQNVLFAGIKHRAKADYPDLKPNEINAAMKALKESGRVRFSAGRWIPAGRW